MPVFRGSGAFLALNEQEGWLQLLFPGRFWVLCGTSGLGRPRSIFSEEKTSEGFEHCFWFHSLWVYCFAKAIRDWFQALGPDVLSVQTSANVSGFLSRSSSLAAAVI